MRCSRAARNTTQTPATSGQCPYPTEGRCPSYLTSNQEGFSGCWILRLVVGKAFVEHKMHVGVDVIVLCVGRQAGL